MIQRKPNKRLGSNGPGEVKNHPWLRHYPWEDLHHKRLRSPFVPQGQDNFDHQNSNSEWKDQNDEEMLKSGEMLRRDSVQDLFSEYYFDEHYAALQ